MFGIGCFKNKQLLFKILVAVVADLFYKSVPGLCLIISRAARYLPKSALNNVPSLSVYTIISMIEELYALFFAESRYIIKLRIFSFCARVKQTNRLKLFLAQDA